MKKARHEAILSLIESENIGTQEALLDRLIQKLVNDGQIVKEGKGLL